MGRIPEPPPTPTVVQVQQSLVTRMFKILLFIVASATLATSFPSFNLPFRNTTSSASSQNNTYKNGRLQFGPDRTFHISIFADLHYGENAWDTWGPQQDINSQRIMRTILDDSKPDFVVLNGDLITGENAYKHNASSYLDTIVTPLVERNLPWGSTYGNHDSSYNLSRTDILSREQSYPNSHTQSMVSGRLAGVTNYYLPIYPSSTNTTKPALLLWFFDSRGGFYYQETTPSNSTDKLVGQPNWVDASVVNWFRSTNHQLVAQHGSVIPSLGFVHIPTNASRALQTEVSVDASRQPGINDDIPLAPQAQGWCADGTDDGSACSYGGQDEAFMQAVTETEGFMGLFSGHDHGDTWCYKWKGLVPGMRVKGNGVNLCFNQHSGYGGYGNWIRGAREVVVSEDMLERYEFDSWIQLEDGKTVGRVSLNSTYGEDKYPVTPNDMTYCPTCDYTVVSPMPGT